MKFWDQVEVLLDLASLWDLKIDLLVFPEREVAPPLVPEIPPGASC
jgi:hypothetical protein